MKNPNQFYAVRAITEDGKKMLCWKDKKYFYFASKSKGFANPPAPTLFRSKKEAKESLNEIPEKGGNMKQFFRIIEAKKTEIVKVNISI